MRVLGTLLHDPWRKLLALALAWGLWSWVYQQITVDETISFAVQAAPAGEAGSPLPNQLQVVIPRDYELVQPDLRSALDLRFRGTRARIQAWRGTADCSAKVVLEAESAGDRPLPIRVQIAPRDWHWSSPEVLAALDDEDARRPVVFEAVPIIRRQMRLQPDGVDLQIALPSERYFVDRDGLQFRPGVVVLVGPESAFESLDAQDAGPPGRILERILSPEPVTTTFVGRFGLDEEIMRLGLRMEPETVEVVVPIGYRGIWHRWTPGPERLVVIGGRDWVPVGGGLLPPLRARLRREVPLGVTIDRAWLEEHVLFLVNTNEIPENATAEAELPVEILFQGVDPGTRRRLRELLEVQTQTGEEAGTLTIPMQPRPPGPEGDGSENS